MAADTGSGATITFGTSTFTAKVTRIVPGEQSREALNTSTLDTTGFETFIPADLADAGECEVQFLFDATLDYPAIGAAAETVTVDFPLQGAGTAASIEGTAFVTTVGWPELANNELQEATVMVKWDGATGPTYTKES